MNFNSATNVINEEYLQMEETGDSYRFECSEIVPIITDTDSCFKTECIGGDWSAEVSQENLAVMKLEPDDVCFLLCYLYYFNLSHS